MVSVSFSSVVVDQVPPSLSAAMLPPNAKLVGSIDSSKVTVMISLFLMVDDDAGVTLLTVGTVGVSSLPHPNTTKPTAMITINATYPLLGI
jgi:hypothetical protein